jgi:putative ABC transport system substrate-binding protein
MGQNPPPALQKRLGDLRLKARHAAPAAIDYRSRQEDYLMRRREFIAGLGSAAVWPFAARAQQTGRMRRVGILTAFSENDQTGQTYIAGFREGLAKLGWVEERNMRFDLRFGGTDADRIRAYAAELVRLGPDVIVTGSAAVTREVQRQTQTIPIVITGVGDPIVNGIVNSLARPEGNTTGVTNLYASIGGKWLELLKEAAPGVERVGILELPYNAQVNSPGYGYSDSIEEAARALAVKAIKMPYRDAVDIVHAIDAFASEPNGGLIVLPPPPTAANRETILRLAAQHRLPAIYQSKSYAAEGGLMAYGSNSADNFRRASFFVDRILRGAQVGELPVEFPTRFELVINLKAAKAIGLAIPEAFLLRADEVIE